MQLPNAESAFIDDRKLLEYCLNPEHEEGKHKARVFLAALGIHRDRYLYPAESGFRKSGSNWSIVGVTASHADNVRGISTFAKHFPPGITLKSAILEAILVEDAVLTAELISGDLYQVDFTMTYLEKSARVRTGWIIRNTETFPSLTTCFVLT
ncbi:MAG: hypothetical protein IPM81_09165 [Saprospirales bacterium]|nr:hypothetical protein [Saprospirales bacterium]